VRGLRAILGALAAAVGAVLLILVGAAAAAGPQASRDEVFHALGVDEINADYVIAVDTSASMQDGDLYGQVTGALRPLLQALPPADHLSLLTFDTVPALRYSGPVGSPGDRALAQLPPRATGANTDLGNAISAAMRELQRPDAARIQTLILITDGKQDAPPGSAYPATSGPGWEQLATRAQALTAVHPIASYALAVRPETDAAVLAQVMPETQVLNLPGDQVAGFFDRVKSDTRAAKARAVLRPDLSQPVQVSWRPADLAGLDLRRGTATTVVSLSSTTTRVPLTLSSLAVRSRGVDVQAVGLPDTLTLAPGATTALPLTLRFHQRGGFGWGQRSVTETGQLEVTGSFGSPWRAVVTDDLGLPFEPKLAGATVATRARGTVGWSWLRLGLGALAAAALVAAGVAVYRGRQPRLRGTMTAVAPGQGPNQVVLGGRTVRIGAVRGSRLAIPGRGRVRGRRRAQRGRRGHDIELVIEYSVSGKAKRGNCRAGGSTTVDGVTFSHRT